MNDWVIKLFEKYNREIRVFIRIIIFFFMLVYIGYFIKFAFEFVGTSKYSLFETILYGLLFTVLMIVLFFIAHFSGGIDFDLRVLVLFLGLAIGGTIIGLFGGIIRNPLGWIVGSVMGTIIIAYTIKLYLKKQ